MEQLPKQPQELPLTEELRTRMEEAFKAFHKTRIENLRHQRAELISSKLYDENTVEAYFDREDRRLSGMDSIQRAATLVNNLHLWAPVDGGYRDIKTDDDLPVAARNKQLIGDLDTCITEELSSPSSKDAWDKLKSLALPARLAVEVKLYFRMLDKGYAREELTS